VLAVSYLFPSTTITFEAALRDIATGSPKARTFAARALGDVEDAVEKRRALEALVAALEDDRYEVRAEACASLGAAAADQATRRRRARGEAERGDRAGHVAGGGRLRCIGDSLE
jgi:hypothetical protein